MVDERATPFSPDAERSVLGAVLLEPGVFDTAVGAGLTAEMFFRRAHQLVWTAMQRLIEAGSVPDFITLRAALEASGGLDEVTPAYLAGLVDGVPKASNVEHYARIVREKAILRKLIGQANQIVERGYAHDADAAEIVNDATAQLMAITQETAKGDFLPAPDWMAEMYAAVERALTEQRHVTGVPTGLAKIDHAMRGFQPGELVLIAARPSVGKTSLALQFALEASRHVFTGFVSMEMSRQSVGFRALALESRIDFVRLVTGNVRPHEHARIGHALEELGGRRLAIDDASGQNVAALCAKVRRLANRHGLGIVFIDYLQLMHASGAENRTNEVGRISSRLKGLAMDLNIPVVALSQLTRDNMREKRRPQLSDLRDSGSLEQDADGVLFIHRPNKPEASSRYEAGEVIELIIAKQRNGPSGLVIEAVWDGPMMRFADPADDPQAPVQERLA